MVPQSVNEVFHFSSLNRTYFRVSQVSKPVDSFKLGLDAAGSKNKV